MSPRPGRGRLRSMPVHDWTRVPAGIFHAFHAKWIVHLTEFLNGGLLPRDFYAIEEQVAAEAVPDILTLRGMPRAPRRPARASHPARGLTVVEESPPGVSLVDVVDDATAYAMRKKSVAVRHVSGDDLAAVIEILSPGNKSSRQAHARVVEKISNFLHSGVHVLAVDILPTGSLDPGGIHGAVWDHIAGKLFEPPSDRVLTFVSYAAAELPRAYVEPIAVHGGLPAMPLFLEPGAYVTVPLEPSYDTAYERIPERWRRVVEGR